jgi:uncharacterized protein (DUF305 family)
VSQAQQSSKPKQAQPSVVQPGAPGKSSKPYTGTAPAMEPTKPDVEFMQGMIMHHGQAVEMCKLLQARSQNKELLELGKRIDISQTDELGFMKRWLQDHGKPISTMEDMPGMDMSSMMPAMPGMLTPEQMAKDLLATPGAAQDALLFDFTTDVDNTQRAEIEIMRRMLAKEKQ